MSSSISPLLTGAYQPIYVGVVISDVLYGIAFAQTVWYYRSYKKDRKMFQWLVGILWFIDTAHQCILNAVIWTSLIARRSQDIPTRLTIEQNWTSTYQAFPSGASTLIVECFYIGRIWILGKSKLTFLILVPAVAAFGLSIAYPVLNIHNVTSPLTASGVHLSKIMVSLSAVAACLTDISSAATMCYLLRRSRSEGLTITRSFVDLLIRFAITTEVLSSVAQIIMMTMVVAPLDPSHQAARARVSFIHGKALNSRAVNWTVRPRWISVEVIRAAEVNGIERRNMMEEVMQVSWRRFGPIESQ